MRNLKVTYDSAARQHPIVEEALALRQYRDLITQFISRSLITRYKRSALGIAWTLLNPILTMLILTLVFSQVFRFDVVNYPVYILAGHTAWLFFSTATVTAMSDMVYSGNLFQRIYVPKTVFPISAVGAGLVNFLLALIPLFLIAAVIGVKITSALLVMPLSILLLVAFTLGLSLILATGAVFFADMQPIYEVLLTLWMYSTPIIYPIEIIPPRLQGIFKLNPMYYLVDLFRAPLYDGIIPDAQTWIIGAAFAVATLVLGSWLFTSKSNEYAYRI